MVTENWHQIMSQHPLPFGKHLISDSLIFKHDNNFKHTPRAVKAYPKTQSATLSLPQNPDINITEAVYDHLHREQKKS